MGRLFNNKRLFGILAALLVLMIVAGITIRKREQITWPEKMVIDLTSWVQGLVYKPVYQVSTFFQDITQLKSLYEENAKLKLSLNNYANLQAQLLDLQSENARLRKDLQFGKKNQGYQFLAAAVTSRNPGFWNSVVTIDKGARDGIQVDMPVVTSDAGLVGRVEKVAADNATVMLVTDTDKVGISALVLNQKRPFGIVTGSSDYPGKLEMSFISKLDGVKKGDMVETSGLSDIFPKGIVIGKIISIKDDPTGLTQTAVIQPTADLNHLEDVLVVKKAAANAPLQPVK
ncbi:rod shape-determining protein MreC [Fodinisporobacter ferrooxydans]|uniref:Cell shape-determining protein MreC n=1 Tax=Fodinisporobacter ferrooxydans TaxID=2901836 RepID=A0ABY4CLN1_9BACL|nr:rod shape-determining protein MreC [Alicyclobacillaceae bacterium MYW30-H2]